MLFRLRCGGELEVKEQSDRRRRDGGSCRKGGVVKYTEVAIYALKSSKDTETLFCNAANMKKIHGFFERREKWHRLVNKSPIF